MAASKSKLKAAAGKRRSLAPSAPEVKLGYATAGRETMAAIAEELANEMRPRQNTLPYADRISNAPGARLPSRLPSPQADAPRPSAPKPSAPTPDDGPEVTVTAEDDVAPPTPRLAPDDVEIFELLTFIVRGNRIGDLSTDALRRRFVEQNLLHRIPGAAIDAVERIEVTPWTAKGTMVVRVWVREVVSRQSSAVS